MRLKLSANVSGCTALRFPQTVLADRFGVSVFPGQDGLITRIEVSTRITDASEELPSIILQSDGSAKPEIKVPSSRTGEELLELLQHIESFGAFWLGIREIDWVDATCEWIPESAEEREQLAVTSYQMEETLPPESPRPFSAQVLWEIVESRDRNESLVIPMALMRQGLNDYRDRRFLSAFYQFYFYLEDLYAEGQWRSKAVKERFLGSQHLQEVGAEMVQMFSAPRYRDDRRELEAFLSEFDLAYTAEGLLQLIVEMRGRLHHFSQKSSLTHGHPLNRRRFKSLAYLLMHTCLLTYQRIVRDGKPN